MAKEIYVGVNGVVRKVKQPYIGVDNIARKVKKAYIGVDNVARLFYVSCEHENASWHEYDDIYHEGYCDCGETLYEEHTYDGTQEDTGEGVWEYCTKCGYAHNLSTYECENCGAFVNGYNSNMFFYPYCEDCYREIVS